MHIHRTTSTQKHTHSERTTCTDKHTHIHRTTYIQAHAHTQNHTHASTHIEPHAHTHRTTWTCKHIYTHRTTCTCKHMHTQPHTQPTSPCVSGFQLFCRFMGPVQPLEGLLSSSLPAPALRTPRSEALPPEAERGLGGLRQAAPGDRVGSALPLPGPASPPSGPPHKAAWVLGAPGLQERWSRPVKPHTLGVGVSGDSISGC